MQRLEFGRSICGDLAAAERREWIVTNGLGGYASGTIAGTLTRRYHGLLIAALRPPLGRTLLVAKFDEIVTYGGVPYALAANRWRDGVIAPAGYLCVERFTLAGTLPTWEYALADALLEKCVWMEHGANTTYVRYAHVRGSEALALDVRALVNYRDAHGNTHAGDWRMAITRTANGICVTAFDGARPFYIAAEHATLEIRGEWYRDFVLAAESESGLEPHDDHLCAAAFTLSLLPGESVTFALSDAVAATLDGEPALRRYRARESDLLGRWERARPDARDAPAWVRHCVLAADQFVVARPLPRDPGALSVIAGYHWFGDWGRDTTIALCGLTLTTGRFEIAASILRTFAAYVDRGMVPNFLPDGSGEPAYNSCDAALWYVEAVAAYVDATGDRALLRELYPVLLQIVAAYRDGTRYGIRVDSSDGLPYAGEAGVQLTWMDAKVDDWVVTPRSGKPVELAALWYNALQRLAAAAPLIARDGAPLRRMASAARAGFERFWNDGTQGCYDVLDGPEGNDPSIRPNQLFAVSLPFSPLDPTRARAVVDTCARHLLADGALRTLDPRDPRYRGRYGGTARERDAAYHQGTAWPWLLGVFSSAYARAHGDAAAARGFLATYADAILDGGIGTLGELVDGDAPFTPRGAIAQAWSVAEALRAWHEAPRYASRRSEA